MSSPRAIRGPDIVLPEAPTLTGGGDASVRIVGETRSVDPAGEPRLWGKGRAQTLVYGPDNGTGLFCSLAGTRFGLSRHAVPWAAAEAACPESSWVCRHEEIEAALPCNTARPDSTQDSLDCAP